MENSAKPGVTPLIINAPIRTAVAASPGIPRLKAGINAPPVTALLATSGANTPSRQPVPGISSLPLLRLQIPDAAFRLINTAIEAPVPGIAPISVPIPREDRIIFHMEAIFLKGGNTLPISRHTSVFCGFLKLSTSTNTWLTPYRPINVEVISKPLAIGVLPSTDANGIRTEPDMGSGPKKANTNPKAPISRPFNRLLPETAAMITIPTKASVHFSAGPNASVIFATIGLKKIKKISEPSPPIIEATTAPPRAWPANPFFVINWPSSAVAMALGFPGIPRRIAGIDAPHTAPQYTASKSPIPVAVSSW